MAEPSQALLTKATIVNWALAEIGRTPNFSIDEESPLGAIVDIFWPRVVGRCFGLSDWTFCRRTNRLTRRSEEPETGYRFGFDLPGDKIGEPMRVLRDPRRDDPIRDFRIEGRVLFCDEETAYTVCKVEVDPQTWDLQFADCFAVALAAQLAIPLREDLELAADKEAKAFGTPGKDNTGGLFGRLMAQNRAAHPVGAPLLQSDPLTGSRGGSAPWHGRF